MFKRRPSPISFPFVLGWEVKVNSDDASFHFLYFCVNIRFLSENWPAPWVHLIKSARSEMQFPLIFILSPSLSLSGQNWLQFIVGTAAQIILAVDRTTNIILCTTIYIYVVSFKKTKNQRNCSRAKETNRKLDWGT